MLLGRSGMVRSAVVNAAQGYGSVDDGGGGLNLQLRSPERELVRGTEVVISTADSPIKVLVVPTNEELVIARDTREIVSRLLKGFAEQGLVALAREQVDIVDPAGLRRIAGG